MLSDRSQRFIVIILLVNQIGFSVVFLLNAYTKTAFTGFSRDSMQLLPHSTPSTGVENFQTGHVSIQSPRVPTITDSVDKIKSCHCDELVLDDNDCYYFQHPREILANRPLPLPGRAPSCLVFDAVKGEQTSPPLFTIILAVFNQEEAIGRCINSILKHTREPFEIVIILDGCEDKSEQQVLKTLQQTGCWDKCEICQQIHSSNSTDHPSWCNPTTCAGVKSEGVCNPDLRRILVIQQKTGVFETASNNMGLRAARGKYAIIVQDDMEMTVEGWNSMLSAPARLYDNIIGVTMRCAVDFNWMEVGIANAHPIGHECGTSDLGDPCVFYLRDTANRGPLLLDNAKARAVGYIDEKNFHLEADEHDLFARAFSQFRWKTGYMRVDYIHHLELGGSRKQTKRTPEQELYLTVLKGRQRDKYYPTFNQFQGMSALYNEDRRLPASLNCPGNPNWWKALANLK